MTDAAPTLARCPEMQGRRQCALLAGHSGEHILASPPASGWARPSRISPRARNALAIALVGLTALVALASRSSL
jgi:hypothetical protein